MYVDTVAQKMLAFLPCLGWVNCRRCWQCEECPWASTEFWKIPDYTSTVPTLKTIYILQTKKLGFPMEVGDVVSARAGDLG